MKLLPVTILMESGESLVYIKSENLETTLDMFQKADGFFFLSCETTGTRYVFNKAFIQYLSIDPSIDTNEEVIQDNEDKEDE